MQGGRIEIILKEREVLGIQPEKPRERSRRRRNLERRTGGHKNRGGRRGGASDGEKEKIKGN